MSGARSVCSRSVRTLHGLLVLVAACASQHPAPKTEGPGAGGASGSAAKPDAAASLQVPIRALTLDNGLRVVLSRDTTAPVVAVAVYYAIGFRIEPRDRTGFAHLFEHMMFQGSQNLGKLEFIKMVQSNGGVLNGSTRFDFTNYFEVVPSNALEMMLWGEADRMRGLAVTQDNLTNQQGVVKSEVRVNVLNRPYGGFPWLDMPQYANKNWHNAHNFYGDLTDLDHATLGDVQKFFQLYYAPNNAALVIVGDLEYDQAEAWVKKYFASIPRAADQPRPDLTEPRQDQEIKAEKVDPLADRPALAVAYHVPDRSTPAFYAFTMLHEILLDGRDSALFQKLVQDRKLAGEVEGGINLLGNPFDYAGPMLWIVNAVHDKDKTAEQLVAAIDEAIEPLRTQPVSASTLARARVKARARLYDMVEGFFGFGRADLLASFALFDNDPAKINQLEAELMKVTPELIQKTAQDYLRPTNRTILQLKAGK
ncbi:MAG: insulinase family protein [Deltaproteobacteria bacterium]|nr:MAG: insulinase family protein [Deltaproteobacteria bacterium]TMQ08302.1 MAG: insulinase family protein [Deltaproteobacteria bacterium]